MELTVSLARPDVDEFRSLHNWLADEPAVRRSGRMRRSGAPDPGAMGDGLDVLTLAVTAGLSVTQLVVALAAWRDSRPRQDSTIVIERGDIRVTLSGPSDPALVEGAIKALDA